MINIAKFQIGKFGINDGVIDSLMLAFKNHKIVRIALLKSAGRDRAAIVVMADEIAAKLAEKTGFKFNYRIIGFTINMNRYVPLIKKTNKTKK